MPYRRRYAKFPRKVLAIAFAILWVALALGWTVAEINGVGILPVPAESG